MGALENTEVRYVLSRLRAGEPSELASSAAITMIQRSLAAFQAHARNEDPNFAMKTAALQVALAAEVEAVDPDVARISAFTGLSTTAMEAAAARLERDLDAIPTTIVGWSEWLIDFLAEDAEARAALLEKDAGLINAVTRGKKAGGATKPAEFDRLKAGLRSWLEGKPFDEIEIALGVDLLKVGTCNRARDLVLKLANRRFYIIAAAIAELVKAKLVAAGREAANPAVLEILAVGVRRGFDTPEKAAFAHLNPSIRTRVGLHRAFGEKFGVVDPMLGRQFRDVLAHIETRLLFSIVDFNEI